MAALRILDLPAQSVRDHPDTVDALVEGRLDVALVREALTPASCAAALATLEGAGKRLEGVPIFPESSPNRDVRLLGTMIAPTELSPRGPELGAYRDAARGFEALCAELFTESPGFAARVAALLSALAAGRDASVPRFEDGALYTAATLRRMPPGSGAPPHRDNNPSGPVYAGLRALCDLNPQLSYYIPLGVPRLGGELQLGTPAFASGVELLAPRAGDLILFPGSRFEHQVLRVDAAPTRTTIGGFCALSADHRALHFWS